MNKLKHSFSMEHRAAILKNELYVLIGKLWNMTHNMNSFLLLLKTQNNILGVYFHVFNKKCYVLYVNLN